MLEDTSLPHVALTTKSNGEVLQIQKRKLLNGIYTRADSTLYTGPRAHHDKMHIHYSYDVSLTCSPLLVADRTGLGDGVAITDSIG